MIPVLVSGGKVHIPGFLEGGLLSREINVGVLSKKSKTFLASCFD